MVLTLADLVRNRTLSPGMAALLAAAAAERRSLLIVAIPRMAGKTTLMDAVLAERPADIPLYPVGTRHGESLGIPEAPAPPGYLCWSEIAEGAVTDSYLWGGDVRQIFRAAREGGHAIATSLHADGLESAFGVVAENGVGDREASMIDLVVYIRSIGHWEAPERRAVAAIYEVERVREGRPVASPVHLWDETGDRFTVAGQPTLVSAESYAHQLARFKGAVDGKR